MFAGNVSLSTHSSALPIPPILHFLICSTHDIAGCVQKVSQNQSVQPVATYIYIYICPSPYVFPYSISSANLVWLLSSIRRLQYFEHFKYLFLEIQECAYVEGFPKSGHILLLLLYCFLVLMYYSKIESSYVQGICKSILCLNLLTQVYLMHH